MQGPASPDEPFKANVTVTPSPWAAGKEIVHIGLQGYDIAATSEPPANLVFLIDVSGSMDEPEQAAAGAEGAERADRPAAAGGPRVDGRLCRRGRRGAAADGGQPEAR